MLVQARNSLYWPGKLRRRNQNKARAGFGTYNHNTLCIISALVSCGWWAAPAGARLFFRCIFSGGRAVRIGPISLPFVSCGWWAASAGARLFFRCNFSGATCRLCEQAIRLAKSYRARARRLEEGAETFGCCANALIARSMSAALCASAKVNRTPNEGAAVSMACKYGGWEGTSESKITATRDVPGAASLSSSSHLPPIECS
jgi:hypothetical protein